LSILKQGFNPRNQRGQFFLNNQPDDLVINPVISVNDEIPEIDDSAGVSDLCRDIRVGQRNASQRFSDDFEIPFDRLSQKPVRLKLLQSSPGDGR